MSDFAQKQLGDIVHAELPTVGDCFEIGSTLASLESVKTVGDIFSPIAGSLNVN